MPTLKMNSSASTQTFLNFSFFGSSSLIFLKTRSFEDFLVKKEFMKIMHKILSKNLQKICINFYVRVHEICVLGNYNLNSRL